MTAQRRLAVTAAAIMVALTFATDSPTATPQGAGGQSAATAKPGSLAVTVLDESGAPIAGATVALRGAVERQGLTGPTGVATLQNIPAGTQRVRISKDAFITFEKEVVLKTGARLTTDAVLSPAPAPPPPPPAPKSEPKPTPPPAGPPGLLGQPRALSIPDLAEQMLKDPQPVVERPLGCSVATSSSLILFRESVAAHAHADADEMIYLVAGDATIKIGDKDTAITPGWFAVVPRGTTHSLVKRGRNAPIILSVRSGPPCGV